ncbi:MAG: carboxypeptidase-like regulatory domain-containing protein [Thermoguttaceae bacterium]|nr:carboxypeptidase-like regulatory domain-containing protein [Thermoguttaceae bacterium]MDW8078794.1 carboxypeptidase-like regulatory domain-containing protein [Thermoguttaceae bacterium]
MNRILVGSLLFCLILAVLNGGCGGAGAGGKVAISGTVTLKGQPLDRGTVTFTSVDPSKQLMAGAQITNGKFSIPADQGLPPGRYRVRFSAPAGGPQVAPGEAPGDSSVVAEERIPPEWGAQSTQEVEIKPGQSSAMFEFNIP